MSCDIDNNFLAKKTNKHDIYPVVLELSESELLLPLKPKYISILSSVIKDLSDSITLEHRLTLYNYPLYTLEKLQVIEDRYYPGT